jgi:hypothetical protein
LRDTPPATPTINSVLNSSIAIPSVKENDKAWEFITEINPGETPMTDTIDSMTDEYQNYCVRHGLPLVSADELLGKLTELDSPSEARRERIYWLTDFINRWDVADREE